MGYGYYILSIYLDHFFQLFVSPVVSKVMSDTNSYVHTQNNPNIHSNDWYSRVTHDKSNTWQE